MHAGAASRLALAVGLALVLACGRGGQEGGQAAGSPGSGPGSGPAARPPAPVKVAPVTVRDVPETLSAVGTVQPSTTVSVRPLVTGTVVAVYFTDGAEVRSGQRLFQIDPRPFQAALAQARANLAHTRQQAANAHDDVRRFRPLLKGGYVTSQQYETAVTTARSLDADLQGLGAAVQQAELNLSHCLITAPISGRTGAVLVQPGNVVEANQTSPLVVVSALKPAYVAFSAPEQDVSELRQGLGRMQVIAQSGGLERQGVLTFLNNTVDPTAGTILARATFPNQDEALWPGAFVDVRVVLGVRRGALTVPPAAIVNNQSGKSVFVVRPDRTVALQPVKVLQTTGDAAVVAGGLAPGEQVVTDGQLNLAPGVRVAVQGQGAPGPGGAAAAVARDGKEAGQGAGAGGDAQ